MTSWVSRIDDAFYPGVEDNWDDEILRQRILSVLRPESVLLDLGAGAGIVRQMDFRGYAGRIFGLDLDPRVEQNPMLDEGRIADAAHIPYPDDFFDVAFADNVLEHLPDPVSAFREVKRVLKPGGMFLFKTPNKWHYMPLIASITPHRFHRYVNRLRGRAEADTFPTRYLANNRGVIRMLAEASGLTVVKIEHIESRPEYLRLTWPTYLLGVFYERVSNSTNAFASFRILLTGQLQKPHQ